MRILILSSPNAKALLFPLYNSYQFESPVNLQPYSLSSLSLQQCSKSKFHGHCHRTSINSRHLSLLIVQLCFFILNNSQLLLLWFQDYLFCAIYYIAFSLITNMKPIPSPVICSFSALIWLADVKKYQ